MVRKAYASNTFYIIKTWKIETGKIILRYDLKSQEGSEK